MCTGRCVFVFGVVAVVVAWQAALWVGNAREVLNIDKPLPASYNTTQGCRTVRGVRGAEDFVMWGDVLIASNLDLLLLYEWPSLVEPSFSAVDEAQTIGLVAVDGANDADAELSLAPVRVVGLPSGVRLHSHGLDIDGNMLLVVNHGFAHGGEQVIYFALERGSDGAVEAHYQWAVDFGTHYGVINDVAIVSQTEFYASQFLRPLYKQGAGSGWRKIPSILYLLNPYGLRPTQLFRCTVGASSSGGPHVKSAFGKAGSEAACHAVGEPAPSWNGLAITKDKLTLLALNFAATGHSEVHVLGRDPSTGDLTPRRTPVQLPHYGDNLIIDEATGRLWVAGVTNFGQCFMDMVEPSVHHRLPLEGGNNTKGVAITPGAVVSLKFPTTDANADDDTDADVRVEWVHDGSLLSMLSVALPLPNALVVGTPCDDGIVACPR
eukprot:m.10897 g.10897  ORF g.10897 m.10897 type:complete len:435 (-) comp3874_c0_seq1:95-1399(-)